MLARGLGVVHTRAARSCGFCTKNATNTFNSFRRFTYTHSPCDFKRQVSLPSQTIYKSFSSATKSIHTTNVTTSYISTDKCIVLCHGFLGFRSMLGLDYFKGVREDLERKMGSSPWQGCEVFVPEVSMTASIGTRAKELHEQIDSYLSRPERSGRSKSVHLICHSMGGLDARRLVHMKPNFKILSITTVSTPHRGSPMAAWSESLSGPLRLSCAPMLALLHNRVPALDDMRPENMKDFNRNYPDVAGIKYFSVGAKFNPWLTHIFYYPNKFIKDFSEDRIHPDAFGPNDGLVSEGSAKWGEFLDFIKQDTSHFGVLGWELLPDNLGGADSSFDAKLLYRRLVDNVARTVEGKAE